MFWITGGTSILHPLFNWMGGPWSDALEKQIKHSSWNGFTFYDLIFPLFLFIVGASLPFAVSRRLENGSDKKKLFIHIVRRTLTLLVLGLIYNGILDFEFAHARYPGVLQRIAICYFFAATIVLWTGIRGQALWAGGLLLGYWAIMTLIPVPGVGAGVLTPEGNLSGYLDRLLLPGRFCCYDFGDNEGILSTIPAVSTTLLGVLSGHWLRGSRSGNIKAFGLALGGVFSLLIGLAWNFVFPINKLIWTSSYVLFAGGWSLLILSFFYFVIDVRGYRAWAFPFVVIGLNAITIYVGQKIIPFGDVADFFIHGFSGAFGSFEPIFVAACITLTKWLFLYHLYRHKIFLKA